jgi:hypothetical protein
VLSILFWQSLARFAGGLLIAFALVLLLPPAGTERLLWGGLAGLACPLLVLGRREQLNRPAYALFLRSLSRPRAWQLRGLIPALVVSFAWSLVIAHGEPRQTLTLLSWSAACVMLGDLFDALHERAGVAWAYATLCLGALYTAPLWGAIWFGEEALSPWLSTLSFNLHPAFAALMATGASPLQDHLLYTLTQSGLVEVRTLPWWSAGIFYALICLTCLELTVRLPLNTEARRGAY